MNTWFNNLLSCRYKCLGWAVFFFVLTRIPVQAASCDPVLAPFPGSDLGYISHGNRCEGFYVSNVSSEGLEVVSVLLGNLYFDKKPDVVLEVSAPNFTQGDVNIRAVAIPLKRYYRMDGSVSPEESMRRPIGDVVVPGQLSAQRLGVFGWVGTESEKTFVPLRVTQKNTAKSASSKEITYLIVRSSVDAILLFSANVVNLGKDLIRAILVDVKREKAYSKSGLTDFLITEDTDLILEAGFDTQEITKRVFAEYKSNYNR